MGSEHTQLPVQNKDIIYMLVLCALLLFQCMLEYIRTLGPKIAEFT
jgi:hypothetical protein